MVPYNLVKKVNAFIHEKKSILDDKVEANDEEAPDENDFELKINEDLHQHERKS